MDADRKVRVGLQSVGPLSVFRTCMQANVILLTLTKYLTPDVIVA